MIFKTHKRNLINRFLISLLGAALMVAAPLIYAERSYVGDWNDIYPASSSGDNANCALCHNSYTSGSGFNSYGSAIESSSAGGISARIVAVENLNSDSDPTCSSNRTEIDANAQPAWTSSAPSGVTGDLDPSASQCPIADAGGPYNGTAGQQVPFDGSASNDPDGTITAWDWTFGDGNVGTGESPVHTYATDGIYDVSLVVTDNDSNSSVPSDTTASIELALQDPVADPGGPYNGVEGQAVAFDGSGSFDPDGGIITQYDWDFGDGNTGISVAPSHIYAADGIYTVTLTVVDDEGAQNPVPAETTAEIATDTDGDGIADALDNCILVPNGPLIPDAGGNSQRDTDGDNYGNVCDPDLDNDLIVNAADLALFKPLYFSSDPDADFNGSGTVNAADLAILKTMFFGQPGPSGLEP